MALSTLRKSTIPFTMVANAVLVNPEISAMAKGIYCYLCSKPDGWQFHNDIICREIKESIQRFRTAINELIDAGFIVRRQFKDDKTNKFGGNVYEIVDLSRMRIFPDTDFSGCGKTVTPNNTDIISNTESIEKDTLSRTESPQRGPSDDSVTSRELFDFWNRELLPERDNVAGIKIFGSQREKKFHGLLQFIKKDQGLRSEQDAFEFFKEQIVQAYDNSPFLQGKIKNTHFKFDLDFCLQQSSFTKIVEGRYED